MQLHLIIIKEIENMLKDLEILEQDIYADLIEFAYDGDDYVNFED